MHWINMILQWFGYSLVRTNQLSNHRTALPGSELTPEHASQLDPDSVEVEVPPNPDDNAIHVDTREKRRNIRRTVVISMPHPLWTTLSILSRKNRATAIKRALLLALDIAQELRDPETVVLIAHSHKPTIRLRLKSDEPSP